MTLDPVPSSVHVGFVQNTCPVRMATEIANAVPGLATVGHFLRNKTLQKKAHSQGGSRDPYEIERALDCRVGHPEIPAVLIDDVMSTGAHLRACATVLRLHGITVDNVLVAGRAVWEVVPGPLRVEPEDIEAAPEFGDTIF